MVVLAVLDMIHPHHLGLALGRILLPLQTDTLAAARTDSGSPSRQWVPSQHCGMQLLSSREGHPVTYVQEVNLLEQLLLVMLELTHGDGSRGMRFNGDE
jgi:hypothetical protein